MGTTSRKPKRKAPAAAIEALLDSANTASAQARNMWLSFLAVMTYLVVALASISDTSMFLNEPLKLPVANVEIPNLAFFIFGPILLCVLHLGLIIQHTMLAQKLHAFEVALNDPARRDAARVRVHSYVFSQLVAGPERSRVLELAMRLMVQGTLGVAPLLVIAYFLIAQLPLHNVSLSYWLRFVFLADTVLLLTVGGFMLHAGRGFMDTLRDHWMISRTWLVTRYATYLLALFFVFGIATVPDEGADRAMARFADRDATGRQIFPLTAWLFDGAVEAETGARKSPFSRNLDLSGFDFRGLVGKLPDADGSENGKDTSNCEIGDGGRSKLPVLDLSYARLAGAVFCGLNIKFVHFKGAILWEADLRHVKAYGVDFRGANLVRADLRGADLRRGVFLGAKFREARLHGADLSRAKFHAADFPEAGFDGAKLVNAELQLANFTDASLRGANLRRASMHGADMTAADLRGADLRYAELHGADLETVRLAGATLKGARLWVTKPGFWTGRDAVDLRDLKFVQWQKSESENLLKRMRMRDDPTWSVGVPDHPCLFPGPTDNPSCASRAWTRKWREYRDANRLKPGKLSAVLVGLACEESFQGAVATAVALRALPVRSTNNQYVYAGDFPTLAAGLLSDTCAGARHMSPDVTEQLCSYIAKDDPAASRCP